MGEKISIIIPVYTGQVYLAEAIESALNQDYENKEVIVVNDGSTDRSQEVIDSFKGQIRSSAQENRGLGASRNRGVSLSTGSYLTFLDQDDRWEKFKLSMQMKEMLVFREKDPLIFSCVKQFICPTLSELERASISLPQPILPGYHAGTLLVSKNRFHQIGPFFEEKKIGEFMEWYFRALEENVPIHMLQSVTMHRRIHQTNMGRQPHLFHRTDFLAILKGSLKRRNLLNIQ